MPRKTKRKTRRKTKIWRQAMKKGKIAKRWMKRHRIVYEIIVSLLIVGGVYFGVMGSLCLALRTDDPYRAVTSGSMVHDTENWQRSYKNDVYYSGYDMSKFSIQDGFERGDLLFIEGVNPLMDVRVGDVIVFYVPTQSIPVVHRVVAINNSDGEVYFTTKGDHNSDPLSFDQHIKAEQILGRVVFVIPKIGYLSLWWRGQ